jgi:hypothetical protein
MVRQTIPTILICIHLNKHLIAQRIGLRFHFLGFALGGYTQNNGHGKQVDLSRSFHCTLPLVCFVVGLGTPPKSLFRVISQPPVATFPHYNRFHRL